MYKEIYNYILYESGKWEINLTKVYGALIKHNISTEKVAYTFVCQSH